MIENNDDKIRFFSRPKNSLRAVRVLRIYHALATYTIYNTCNSYNISSQI